MTVVLRDIEAPEGAAPPARRRGSAGRRLRALSRRLLTMLGAVMLVFVASFALVRLIPGDPATRIAGLSATPEVRASIRAELGLDKPLGVQFVDYTKGVLRGDFGESFGSGAPVSSVIESRLPQSLALAGASFGLVLIVSIPLGIFVGIATRENRHRRFEAFFTATTSVVHAVPDYLMATFLVFVFAVTADLLPVAGYDGPSSLVLPAFAVALAPAMVLARLTRIETRRVLSMDYIRTVRAKRLPARRIYFVHVLPNVLTSTLTVGGLILTGIIGGAVVVENVFAWPGLGTEVVQAIARRDYPVVQAIVLMLGVVIVVVNAAVDVLIALLDPRSAIRED